MNFNYTEWFDSRILIFMGISLFLNAFVVHLWHKNFYQKLGLKSYRAIQRIHLKETPRFGGLIFILSLFLFVAFSNSNESLQTLKVILLALVPIIIIGLKEDLFHNVSPTVRLLALFSVGWLFRVQFTGPLPNLVDVPLLGKLLALQGGIGLFYILCMTSIANGMNLIDGVHGLSGSVALSILSALLFLSYKTNDIMMLKTITGVILIFLPFMFFNYPFGKIFLGDLGAYSLGLVVSMLTITLFGRHPEISPWAAVLILIYPAIEVSFSLLRRIFAGSSAFDPDKSHLHLRLFDFFRAQPTFKKVANPFVMITLFGLWIFPSFTIPWVYHKPFLIWVTIFSFIILYAGFYAFIPDAKKMVTWSKR